MLIRLFFLLLFSQISIAQEIVTKYLDSLSVTQSESEKSRLSLKIASELITSNWTRSQYYIDVAEEAALDSKSLEVLARFNVETGEIYEKKDALDVSLDYYLKAYEFYKDKSLPDRYNLENNLAIIYARVNNHEIALEFFRRNYNYQKSKNDTISIAKTFNNIGNLYLETQVDSSIVYYKKALNIAQTLNNDILYFYLYTNLGRAYRIKGEAEKSKYYFNKTATINNEAISNRIRSWYYNEFSSLYLNDKKPDSSIYYAEKAQSFLESIAPYGLERLKSVELLYAANRLNKDFEKSATYFDLLDGIRDSINIEEKKINVKRILIEEEYKSKEKIRTLKEGKRLFKYYIIGLSLFVLLLILILLLIKIRSKLKSTQLEKELIYAKRKELKAKLEFKNNELIGKAMTEIHRTEIIDEILIDLKGIKRRAVKKETQQAIDYIAKRLERDTKIDIWREFEVRFEKVHESFYKNLFEKHPSLTSKDKRLCALLKLDLTSKEIAQITNQSFKSVENSRTRLRKKLEITNSKTDLSSYLSEFD